MLVGQWSLSLEVVVLSLVGYGSQYDVVQDPDVVSFYLDLESW